MLQDVQQTLRMITAWLLKRLSIPTAKKTTITSKKLYPNHLGATSILGTLTQTTTIGLLSIQLVGFIHLKKYDLFVLSIKETNSSNSELVFQLKFRQNVSFQICKCGDKEWQDYKMLLIPWSPCQIKELHSLKTYFEIMNNRIKQLRNIKQIIGHEKHQILSWVENQCKISFSYLSVQLKITIELQ